MASVSDENVQENEAKQLVGKRLRLAREAKKFSVAEVAAQLRFTKDTIIHLENQHWDKLHGRAYARGYFSSYVKFLDLPQNEMLSAFNIEYKSSPADLMQPQFNLTKKKSFPWMPVVFIVIAIVLTGFAYIQWQQSQSTEQDNLSPDFPWQLNQEDKTDLGTDAFDDSVVEPIPADKPSSGEPVKYYENDQNAVELEVEIDSSNESSLELNEPPETGEKNEFQLDAEPGDAIEELQTSESLLELSSAKDCWIEVRDADANILVYQTLSENKAISLTATAPLTVILGSASSATVKFNGTVFDTAPYTQANVAKFILRAES
jgi:cytoskeleton protein RodZ